VNDGGLVFRIATGAIGGLLAARFFRWEGAAPSQPETDERRSL